ncbi:hypothetical protein JHK87_048888 [Glycine soja]|nr:hypothetical protein JHK87_048888 [Glycine soja]
MSKFVGVFLLLLITVTVAEYDHSYPEHENEKNGPCGKFSTLRILTHKLRHCEKAARNAWAPVSSQCCNDLVEVSIPCLYAVFSSDAFKRVGVDPRKFVATFNTCSAIVANASDQERGQKVKETVRQTNSIKCE